MVIRHHSCRSQWKIANRQKESENLQFEEKKKQLCNIVVKDYPQKGREIKKRPDPKLRKERGALSKNLHLVMMTTCEKERDTDIFVCIKQQ